MSPFLGLSLVLTFLGFLILEMQNQKCKRLNTCTLFYKQHFYKQCQTETGKKSQANSKQHNEAELLVFENYWHSSSTS